jgi:hypothetical protein
MFCSRYLILPALTAIKSLLPRKPKLTDIASSFAYAKGNLSFARKANRLQKASKAMPAYHILPTNPRQALKSNEIDAKSVNLPPFSLGIFK